MEYCDRDNSPNFNLEVEQVIVGHSMNGDTVEEVAETITPNMISDGKLKKYYQGALHVYREGYPPDPPTVMYKLREKGEWKPEIDSFPFLDSLRVLSEGTNPKYFVDKLLSRHKQQIVKEAIRSAYSKIEKGELGDIGILIDDLRKSFESVSNTFDPSTWCIMPNDLEDIKTEFLIPSTTPSRKIKLYTAKYGGGKSLLVLAEAKMLVELGVNVEIIDVDMGLDSVKTRLEQAGLLKYLGNKLKYCHRSKVEISISPKNPNWIAYKKYLQTKQPLYLVLDNLKALTPRGVNLNDDLEAKIIMEELKQIRDMGHTVTLIHHINKSSEQTHPSKNSGTIIDEADIAYSVDYDSEKQIFILSLFKDRDKVKKKVTYKFSDDFTLTETINPDIDTVRETIEELEEKGFPPKQGDVINALEGILSRNKVISVLEQGENNYWTCKTGEKNSKLYSVFQFTNYINDGKQENTKTMGNSNMPEAFK